MKAFAGIVVGGTVTLLIFKLLATLVLPLLGAMIGLVLMVIKWVVLAMVAYFVYSMFFKRRREQEVA